MEKKELNNNQLTLAINDLIENVQDTFKRLLRQDSEHIHLAINNLLEIWLEFTRRVVHDPEALSHAQLVYWQDYLLLCKDLNQRLRDDLTTGAAKAEKNVILTAFFEKFSFLISQHVQVVIKTLFAGDNEEDHNRVVFFTRQFSEAFKESNPVKRSGEFYL
jgi:hypothetical protein